VAIDDYSGLQDAVASWLNRDDVELLERIPDFIALAEVRIGREMRRRTIVSPFTVASGATSSTLPEDCGELRYIRHASAIRNGAIKLATPVGLDQYRELCSGPPEAAAVVNGNLLWNRQTDGSYDLELVYFAALTPLSDDAPTNGDLSDAPDIYLFGALSEAAPFLEHDERIATWEQKYQNALSLVNDARERAELGAAPMEMALPVVFG